ncbi:MAG: hypothetical protein ACRDEB_09275, partial [Chitinophagaceae bacterium]
GIVIEESPSKSKKWMIPVVIMLLIAVILTFYFIFRDKKNEAGNQAEPESQKALTENAKMEPNISDTLPEIITETKKSTTAPLPITISFLQGTWKLEWGPQLQAGETVIIDQEGKYYANGVYSFYITNFEYDKNESLIKFTKNAISDGRVLVNTLSVKSNSLLEGFEANYNVRYTRLSGSPQNK